MRDVSNINERRQTIAAIETVYRGVTFRSRLEARWALFFETLGYAWLYEQEAYRLDEVTSYLPDFVLPEPGLIVEIKPSSPTKEVVRKCCLLSTILEKGVVICAGEPGAWLHTQSTISVAYEGEWQQGDFQWRACAHCSSVGIGTNGVCKCSPGASFLGSSERIIEAVETANSHRFWR